MTLTTDDIKKILRGEKRKRFEQEGFTSAEFQEMAGVRSSRPLAELVKSGRVELAGRREFNRIDGVHHSKPIYRFVECQEKRVTKRKSRAAG